MTNEEWLSGLSTEEKAKFLAKHCMHRCNSDVCIKSNCEDGILSWLRKKYEKPMPKIKVGDYIFYEYSGIVYKAFCVFDNIIYLIARGVCTIFDGEIKQRTVTIKRYNTTKETMEDIWRADNVE